MSPGTGFCTLLCGVLMVASSEELHAFSLNSSCLVRLHVAIQMLIFISEYLPDFNGLFSPSPAACQLWGGIV